MSFIKENLPTALENKVKDPTIKTIGLGIMAGIYISIGASFYSVLTSLPGDEVLLRLLGALLFTIGLMLVIFKKAQLFTGNNLMFLNWLTRQTSPKQIARNWFLVYLGNFLGAILTAAFLALIFSKIEPIRVNLESIAYKKTNYSFYVALYKAVFCNMLVCLAVVLGISFQDLKKKLIGIIAPITLFVFLGFEHSIANMFFIPVGLIVGEVESAVALSSFIKNIIPVTLGNIIGGFIISLSYIFIVPKSTR